MQNSPQRDCDRSSHWECFPTTWAWVLMNFLKLIKYFLVMYALKQKVSSYMLTCLYWHHLFTFYRSGSMTTPMPAYLTVCDLLYIYRDLLLLMRTNKISVECLVNSLLKLSKTYLWKTHIRLFVMVPMGPLLCLEKCMWIYNGQRYNYPRIASGKIVRFLSDEVPR